VHDLGEALGNGTIFGNPARIREPCGDLVSPFDRRCAADVSIEYVGDDGRKRTVVRIAESRAARFFEREQVARHQTLALSTSDPSVPFAPPSMPAARTAIPDTPSEVARPPYADPIDSYGSTIAIRA